MVARETPLLVQPIDRDVTFAAKFDRYSGVVQNQKGVEGQRCIPNCARTFSEERPHGFLCSF